MALLVPDELWLAIEPLLPPVRPKPKGGRPRASDRAALAGILFVLRTGIQWHEVPAELGCCGKTCWRRLGEWHAAGVWAGLHRVLLEQLHGAGALNWSRAALDSASLPAKKGGGGRAQPDGPRQAGHEAPSGHGCPRHAAWPDAERCQPQRQHDVGSDPGRRARRAGQAPWAAAQATDEAAR